MITHFKNVPTRARSRRVLFNQSPIDRKLKRLVFSVIILVILAAIYFVSCIVENAAVFFPVRAANLYEPIYETVERKITVIQIKEVDRRYNTEKQQILAYIVEKFGDRSADAITLINKCENHAFNPNAINHNRNGTVDRGIFQINSIHGGEEMFDWKKNIDMAYRIYKSHGEKFTAWTCSKVIGERNYLGEL